MNYKYSIRPEGPLASVVLFLSSFLIHASHASPVSAVASLHRQFTLNGFHRELVTSVNVALKADVKKPCQMALKEEIPSGMYLDSDQIDSLQSWENYQVMPSEVFNTEQPEHRSHSVSVVIYRSLEKTSNKELNATVILPVHFRYHQVADKDFAQITLADPQVLIRCEDSVSGDEKHTVNLACDKSKANLCKWHKVTVRSDKKSLTSQIPVGKSQHYTLVLVGTQIVSIATTLLLALLMESKNIAIDQ